MAQPRPFSYDNFGINLVISCHSCHRLSRSRAREVADRPCHESRIPCQSRTGVALVGVIPGPRGCRSPLPRGWRPCHSCGGACFSQVSKNETPLYIGGETAFLLPIFLYAAEKSRKKASTGPKRASHPLHARPPPSPGAAARHHPPQPKPNPFREKGFPLPSTLPAR